MANHWDRSARLIAATVLIAAASGSSSDRPGHTPSRLAQSSAAPSPPPGPWYVTHSCGVDNNHWGGGYQSRSVAVDLGTGLATLTLINTAHGEDPGPSNTRRANVQVTAPLLARLRADVAFVVAHGTGPDESAVVDGMACTVRIATSADPSHAFMQVQHQMAGANGIAAVVRDLSAPELDASRLH